MSAARRAAGSGPRAQSAASTGGGGAGEGRGNGAGTAGRARAPHRAVLLGVLAGLLVGLLLRALPFEIDLGFEFAPGGGALVESVEPRAAASLRLRSAATLAACERRCS